MLRERSYEPAGELDQQIFAAVVPADHYLRQVLAVIDFERCGGNWPVAIARTTVGQHLEPLLLLKLEFLEFHYNLSDREVIERARCDMAFEAMRRTHWRIERKLGEMVHRHGARRARYRGHARTLVQALLTGIVVNVKRVIRMVAASGVRPALVGTS